MKTLVSLTVLSALLISVGCERQSAPPAVGAAPPATGPVALAPGAASTRDRGLDPSVVARGEQLYGQYCAGCHGKRGEGAPNWHQPGPDGKYPPPPLDGSAHAWHHSRAALKRTIQEGTAKIGGSMPAWKDKLSDADIDAVIDWMIASWPDDIYVAWRKLDAGGGRR